MNFKDMRIGTQIKIGMGAILALVAILAVLALFQTGRLWEQTTELKNRSLQVRRAIGQLRSDILIIHWAMEELFARYDSRSLEHALPLITARELNARKQFDILFDRYSGERGDVEELHRAVEKCRANREQVLRLLQAGELAQAKAVNIHGDVGPDTRHLREVMSLLQTVDDTSRTFGDQYYLAASRHHRDMARNMVFSVAVIVLITAGIGFCFYLWISRPLKALTRLVEEYRKGNFSIRSSNVPANEFATLARAFDDMAESISFQMNLRDTNEHISETMLSAKELSVFRKNLLETLAEATDSQLGVYFLRNTAKDVFEPFASMGVEQDRLRTFKASALEGEMGKVLTTRSMVRLQDIPEDSVFQFRTFAGVLRPREIISFPIVLDGVVRGVVSLASVKPYPAKALEIFLLPWATLVHTVFANLLASDETRRLSEELRETNQELQVQQEELQSQADELLRQTEELQSQNAELERQRQAVEEATRLKSQFLSNMSHELRTPLNSVLALSRVLMLQTETRLSEEERGYLEIIERNGKNLLHLINDILDLSRIEAGRMDVHPRHFALGQALDNVVENVMPLAREKSIELRRDIPPELPVIESDEVRLNQILQNLLSNAVKFTDLGNVSIAARADRERVFIRVADTGIGIAQSDLPHIFEEFRQVDGTSSRRHEGSGLGLAIAHRAARLLGGDISVESAPGAGSTFTLSLPLRWPGAVPVRDRTGEIGLAANGSGRPSVLFPDAQPSRRAKILLVEDNEAAIVQVKSALESAGYLVDVATGGHEAIAHVAQTVPDGIVLDLMMPEVDGFAVLETIRGTLSTANIPVLVLTAKDLTPDDFKRLSANNIQQLVQKGDVDRESLLEKVRAMILKS